MITVSQQDHSSERFISKMIPNTEFTPLLSLFGGFILSVSTTLLLLFTGHLLGLSGIFEGAIQLHCPWKYAFVSGFILSAQLSGYLFPELLDQQKFSSSFLQMCITGFLVGLGTRVGCGCTSGHGISGLARLSRRSIFAVLTFFTSALMSASIFSFNGWNSSDYSDAWDEPRLEIQYMFRLYALASIVYVLYLQPKEYLSTLCSWICGGLFSMGLVIAGMTQRPKIINFLTIRPFPEWDPSLCLVLAAAMLPTAFSIRWILRNLDAPILCSLRKNTWRVNQIHAEEIIQSQKENNFKIDEACKFGIPCNDEVDESLIFGSWLFGIGWGISGLCPGPSVVMSSLGYPKIALVFLPFFVLGVLTAPFVRCQLAQFSGCIRYNKNK